MRHYRAIHYLRAVAALMVVWFHIHYSVQLMRPFGQPYMWMQHGVDIFFVISGFVMTLSTDENTPSARDFFARRVERIVPLYWIMTLVTMSLSKWEWPLVIASIFFLPVLHSSNGPFQPLLPPGWTLNYEMFFYSLFAISLILNKDWRFWFMMVTLCGLVLVGSQTTSGTTFSFYTSPIVLEFLVGMAIARYRWRLPVAAVPLGFALMAFGKPPIIGGVDFGQILPAAVIVAGTLPLEGRLPQLRLMDLLGDASYAIYLTHLISLAFLLLVWPQIDLGEDVLAALSFTTAVVTGVVVHLCAERPIMAWFKSRRSRVTGVRYQTVCADLGRF
jgi:exopolysaccharide production protein ExoZ